VEPAVRSNLVIAIGDLAFRFPNLLEPWTPHMYRSLADSDIGEHECHTEATVCASALIVTLLFSMVHI